MKKKITVIHADDQLLYRKAIKAILEDENIAVIAGASNGQELLDLLAQGIKADVILLDLEMPVLDGQKALEQIVANYPENKVILFSSLMAEPYIQKTFIRMGAYAALNKTVELNELITTIIQAATQQQAKGKGN